MLKRIPLHVSLLTAILTCAALPAGASADWHQPVGGSAPINASSSRNADAGNLLSIAGTPYVAWAEDTTQAGQGNSSTIHVDKLAADGDSWTRVGSTISLRSTASSDNPWLANIGGTPWVAWQEGVTQQDVEIRVSKLSGSSWMQVPVTSGDPINHDGHGGTATDGGGNASQPTLIGDGTGHPYVSFSEFDPGSGSLLNPSNLNPGQIWVDQLNQAGDGWNEVGGGSANANPSSDALFPRMAVINGVPWIAYWQIIPPNGGPPSVAIDVAHLSADGHSWVQTGPVSSAAFGNNGPTLGAPSIADVGGTPYVTFTTVNANNNHQIMVYSFDGSSWNQVGSGPASDPTVDSESPGIAGIDGSPWVTWYTSNGPGLIETAELVNGSWQQIGSSPNDNTNDPASNGNASSPTGHSSPAPSLASINGIPWVGFVENDESQPQAGPPCCLQTRVSRLEPTFLSQLAQPSGKSATLVTKLQTYGLPYRVGFKWGRNGTLSHTTSLSAVSGDPAYALTSISGLTPSSLYSYMPVASAGTPEPLVEGPNGPFVTQPANAPGPLYAFFLRLHRHLPEGTSAKLHYFVSSRSLVEIQLRHEGKVLARWQRTVSRGTHNLIWDATRSLSAGGYVVELIASSGGRTARDYGGFAVVK